MASWLPESWMQAMEYFVVTTSAIPQVNRIRSRKRLADLDATWDAAEAFDHTEWDGILRTHIYPGGRIVDGDDIIDNVSLVDYAGLAADPRFESYLSRLAAANVESLPQAEQLALLLNAYNALCISLVVRHNAVDSKLPLLSINDLSTAETKVWDLPAGTLGGRPVSLNELEHKMLRGMWDEPNLHACIVCASASCPNLRAAAYIGDGLGAQMREQMRLFVRNPSKGIDWRGGVLRMSRIFLWFALDFGGRRAAAAHAVAMAVAADGDADLQLPPNPKVVTRRYFRYSWRLNEHVRQQPATTS
mmetsp:Transcript_15931/g.41054  ORF Transcript_15931/g.41054 Transcript_15931/m.41054 type:complete len:303 (+) Transcript_15931:39-947(+)